MDKETLSNYGWIVICVLVLAVMIALATPFGSFVSQAVQSTTKGLFDVNKSALDSTGLINIDDQTFDVPDMNYGAENGGNIGETPVVPEKPEDNVILSSFSIQRLDGVIEQTFTFEDGMTWEEFLKSDYNTPDENGACFKIYAYASYNNVIGYYTGRGYQFVHDDINSTCPELASEKIITNNNYIIAADGDLVSPEHQGGSND